MGDSMTGTGISDFRNHELSFVGPFTSGDTTIDFNLHATVENFAPRIDLPAAFSASCGFGITIAADDVAAIAVDDCDPHPAIRFVSGSSSQPDDGAGDGATSNDLVVKPDSVCVRDERQGLDLAGRSYSVTLVATDASGNASPETEALLVEVPHDQRPSSRCDVTGGSRAASGDPRCIPEPAATGCAAAGERSSTGAGLLVVLLLIWRRRRSAE